MPILSRAAIASRACTRKAKFYVFAAFSRGSQMSDREAGPAQPALRKFLAKS